MKRKINVSLNSGATYFVTTTVTEFIPIFQIEPLAEILLNNVDFYIRQLHIKLHGFVIMPTHIHLLFTTCKEGDLSKFTGRVKEYSGKQIITWCEQAERSELLNIFSSSAKRHKRQHHYQVWQERYDDLVITTVKMFKVKMDYIHNNPIQEQWKLCEDIAKYRFSSARNYIYGDDVGVPITKMEY
ncbi:MAG: transposase [Chloroflexi bacterium]|nr:transposase [Chloroflexota bacterium]